MSASSDHQAMMLSLATSVADLDFAGHDRALGLFATGERILSAPAPRQDAISLPWSSKSFRDFS